MKSEYLLFNFLIFTSPFWAKLFYRGSVLPNSIKALTAISIPAFIFILWDVLVTGYFWYFNKKYVLGIFIGGVPIEEWLFFFTVPYACLFIWNNLKISEKKIVMLNKLQIPAAFLIFLSGSHFLLKGIYYTGIVLVVFSAVLLIDIILGSKIMFTKKNVVVCNHRIIFDICI